MIVWIYALKDPRTGVVRYVGQSNRPEARLRQHMNGSGSTRVSAWVTELSALSMEPYLELLEMVDSTEADAYEMAWIDRLAAESALLNVHHCANTEQPASADLGIEQHYTVKQIAEHFKVSRQAVYDWISSGRLGAIKLGERVRIPESALRAFIQVVQPGESITEDESGRLVLAGAGV